MTTENRNSQAALEERVDFGVNFLLNVFFGSRFRDCFKKLQADALQLEDNSVPPEQIAETLRKEILSQCKGVVVIIDPWCFDVAIKLHPFSEEIGIYRNHSTYVPQESKSGSNNIEDQLAKIDLFG